MVGDESKMAEGEVATQANLASSLLNSDACRWPFRRERNGIPSCWWNCERAQETLLHQLFTAKMKATPAGIEGISLLKPAGEQIILPKVTLSKGGRVRGSRGRQS